MAVECARTVAVFQVVAVVEYGGVRIAVDVETFRPGVRIAESKTRRIPALQFRLQRIVVRVLYVRDQKEAGRGIRPGASGVDRKRTGERLVLLNVGNEFSSSSSD